MAERAWGTVREDYSATGDPWSYFPHDHARSRAYRWNEDGIGGFCNRFQNVCMGLALWNERDPFLKERFFGLAGPEGNHGEDVKEYYFYLDATPTHSYMKMLYKYPQVEYPYAQLADESRRRSRQESEFELFDAIADAFRAGRYFDVFIEYARADQEDILCRVTAINRGAKPAALHILPHLWFRNTWAWGYSDDRPELQAVSFASPPCVMFQLPFWHPQDVKLTVPRSEIRVDPLAPEVALSQVPNVRGKRLWLPSLPIPQLSCKRCRHRRLVCSTG